MYKEDRRQISEYNNIAESILVRNDLNNVKRSVSDAIQGIIDSRELTDEIFRHPLGFLDFPISMIYQTKYKMRLHIWKGIGDGDVVSNIHFHNADILSFVLSGQIQDEQFYMVDGTQDRPATHDVLRVEYYDGGSRRVQIGREGSPIVGRVQVTSAGGVYFVPQSVYHRSTVKGGQATVTLMVSFNEDASKSHHALVEKSGERQMEFPSHLDIEKDEVIGILRAARTAIAV